MDKTKTVPRMRARTPFVVKIEMGKLGGGCCFCFRLGATRRACGAVALGEFINSACGINEALFSRVEGMAGGTDADADGFHRAAGVKNSAASAGDGGFVGFGMDSFFHGNRM